MHGVHHCQEAKATAADSVLVISIAVSLISTITNTNLGQSGANYKKSDIQGETTLVKT